MFNNIGERLKTLAKVFAVLGIIGSVISGIVLMSLSEYLIGAGLTTMISGSLVSWISSWGMYAMGDTNAKVTEMYNRSFQNAAQNNNNSYITGAYFGNASNASSKPTHLFRCDKCGTMISDYPCVNCGYRPKETVKCPNCGIDVLADEAFCSECGTKIIGNVKSNATGKCEMCSKDNTPLYKVKIVDDMGTRHRKVCNECLGKYNCQPD